MCFACASGHVIRNTIVKPVIYLFKARPFVLAGVVVALASCASLFSSAYQPVTVQVTCKGRQVMAECQASNSKGRWVFRTPQTQNVLRDSTPLRVACYSSLTGEYGVYQYPGVNPVSVGNAVVGGLVGTAVDTAETRVWQYPSVISIENELCKRNPS